MAEYYHETNKVTKTWSSIKADNPNTSFSASPSVSTIERLGYKAVFETPAPSPSATTKIIIREGVEKDSKGNWVTKWVEKDRHADIVDKDGKVTTTKAAQDTAYQAKLDSDTATTNRIKRGTLLTETDFYALADVTLSDNMKTYRQALRDLPTHSKWPNLSDSDWPTKPS